jgi:hypothetical protein
MNEVIRRRFREVYGDHRHDNQLLNCEVDEQQRADLEELDAIFHTAKASKPQR